MSATMKAAVVRAFGAPLVIEALPIPSPAPGPLLIRLVASGVCHADVHAADGDWPVRPTLPFIPGHEGEGDVVAIGRGVTGFEIGDRVGVPWLHRACGECEYCASGRETLCATQQNTGYTVNGGYAEFMLADARFVGRIPEGLDPLIAAPVLCAGVTTYKGLKETEAAPGQWVVISGVRGLGHMAVQYAKAMGFRVIAVDVAPDKLALARTLGAELVIDARRGDAAESVQRATGGAHAVLVTAVNTQAFAAAIDMLRSGGTCVLVGLPPGDFPMPIFPVVLKRLTVRGSIVGLRTDLAEALDFAARGLITVESSSRRLEDVNAIFADLRAGKVTGRVVLDLQSAERRVEPRAAARVPAMV